MTRSAILVAVALMTVVPPRLFINVNKSHSGKSVIAKVGDIIVLDLQFQPGTGYAWSTPEVYGGVLEQQGGLMTIPNFGNEDPADSKQISRWRFRVVDTGTGTLKSPLRKYGSPAPPKEVFNLRIIAVE